MSIHFTGFDGFYEVYTPTDIIHRKLDQAGKVTFRKDYKNINDIPNKRDREKIFEILFGKKKLVSKT
jgi:hypothetical protein